MRPEAAISQLCLPCVHLCPSEEFYVFGSDLSPDDVKWLQVNTMFTCGFSDPITVSESDKMASLLHLYMTPISDRTSASWPGP